MPTPDPCLLSEKLLRLASIAIEYEDESDYEDIVRLYHRHLGLSDCPAPGTVFKPSYSFPVGEGKDIELRVSVNKTLTRGNRTAIYWEVADNIPAFEALYDYLRKLKGFEGRKRRHKTPNKKFVEESERSLLEDSSGNWFGQIINPPYPRGKVRPRRGLSKGLFLLAGVAAGVLLGPLFAGKNRR